MNNVDEIKTRARGVILDQIDRRSTTLGMMLQEHVSNLRSMSETLSGQGLQSTANLVNYAADRLNGASKYLTETDGDRIVYDVESVARENAVVTGAVGLVVGLAAARLLKASASRRYEYYGADDAT